MDKMLMEVDTDNFELIMMDGSVWSINPADITVCCTWIPTSELLVKKNSNAVYNYTITNDGIRIFAMRRS